MNKLEEQIKNDLDAGGNQEPLSYTPKMSILIMVPHSSVKVMHRVVIKRGGQWIIHWDCCRYELGGYTVQDHGDFSLIVFKMRDFC